MVKSKNRKIQYGECSAVIKHTRNNGKELAEITTWKGDTIGNILDATNLIGFEVGDVVTISITEHTEQ